MISNPKFDRMHSFETNFNLINLTLPMNSRAINAYEDSIGDTRPCGVLGSTIKTDLGKKIKRKIKFI